MKLVILAALIKCYNLKAKQYINNYREYMYMTTLLRPRLWIASDKRNCPKTQDQWTWVE